MPLAVIAAQLGHSDTRMVEKHYGHLSPGYVADTVRAAFGSLGLVEPSNVVPIAAAALDGTLRWVRRGNSRWDWRCGGCFAPIC